MLTFVVRRLLTTVPVVAFVAFVVFSILHLAPGNPAEIIAGDQATPEQIAAIHQALGLDQPFFLRFVQWFWQVLNGDLGQSIFSRLPVTTLIAQRLEPTLALMTLTLVLSIVVAIPTGVAAAAFQGRWLDRAVMAMAVAGFSVPVFVIGYLLAWIFSIKLNWFPVQGYTPLSAGLGPCLANLVLPACALSGVYTALLARMTRTALIETLSQDYIRTARAKGLAEIPILFRHALKNAAIPIVTVIGIGIALLLGGAVVTETVFAIPGIGRLIVDAILRRDYPVIQGVILLISLSYVLINLGIDLLYTFIDPRVRY
jgi:peptide/nickel transport system permease protein